MDFPLILLILTVVTGVFWFGDIFVWKKKRAEAARAAVAEESEMREPQAKNLKNF